jgi:hypothetical protein
MLMPRSLTRRSRAFPVQKMSEHRIVVSGLCGHALEHVPVLHYFAVIVEPEDINPGPIAIIRLLLMAMQDDVITFGNHSLECNVLARILPRHPLEVGDESLLAVCHSRIMLNIDIADIPLDSL